jgi:hypothetical protein
MGTFAQLHHFASSVSIILNSLFMHDPMLLFNCARRFSPAHPHAAPRRVVADEHRQTSLA